MDELTATVAETRANFSKIATTVNTTGRPVTVFKNSKPWVVIAPVGAGYGDHIPAIDWSALDVVAMDREGAWNPSHAIDATVEGRDGTTHTRTGR